MLGSVPAWRVRRGHERRAYGVPRAIATRGARCGRLRAAEGWRGVSRTTRFVSRAASCRVPRAALSCPGRRGGCPGRRGGCPGRRGGCPGRRIVFRAARCGTRARSRSNGHALASRRTALCRARGHYPRAPERAPSRLPGVRCHLGVALSYVGHTRVSPWGRLSVCRTSSVAACRWCFESRWRLGCLLPLPLPLPLPLA